MTSIVQRQRTAINRLNGDLNAFHLHNPATRKSLGVISTVLKTSLSLAPYPVVAERYAYLTLPLLEPEADVVDNMKGLVFQRAALKFVDDVVLLFDGEKERDGYIAEDVLSTQLDHLERHLYEMELKKEDIKFFEGSSTLYLDNFGSLTPMMMDAWHFLRNNPEFNMGDRSFSCVDNVVPLQKRIGDMAGLSYGHVLSDPFLASTICVRAEDIKVNLSSDSTERIGFDLAMFLAYSRRAVWHNMADLKRTFELQNDYDKELDTMTEVEYFGEITQRTNALVSIDCELDRARFLIGSWHHGLGLNVVNKEIGAYYDHIEPALRSLSISRGTLHPGLDRYLSIVLFDWKQNIRLMEKLFNDTRYLKLSSIRGDFPN